MEMLFFNKHTTLLLCKLFCCRPLDELPLREIGGALDDPFDDEAPQVSSVG